VAPVALARGTVVPLPFISFARLCPNCSRTINGASRRSKPSSQEIAQRNGVVACPLRVKIAVLPGYRSLPVYLDNQTFSVGVGMSQTCTKAEVSLLAIIYAAKFILH